VATEESGPGICLPGEEERALVVAERTFELPGSLDGQRACRGDQTLAPGLLALHVKNTSGPQGADHHSHGEDPQLAAPKRTPSFAPGDENPLPGVEVRRLSRRLTAWDN
jgi:hypothetical protein